MSLQICYVCSKNTLKHVETLDSGNRYQCECPLCGKFTIGKIAARNVKNMFPSIVSWIRECNLRENEPTILSQTMSRIKASLPSLSTAQKSMRLLKNFAMRSNVPGHPINYTHLDYPLAWARDTREFEYHLRALESEGYAKFTPNSSRERANGQVEILPKGWSILEFGGSQRSGMVFVAMSFSETLKHIFDDGILLGIRDAGYIGQRVDSVRHVDRIDQKIISDIRQSDFVVADVTENKAGVYFEAGYALGKGKTVIWTVRKSDIAQVHFDTRQFAHILWNDAHNLRRIQTSERGHPVFDSSREPFRRANG